MFIQSFKTALASRLRLRRSHVRKHGVVLAVSAALATVSTISACSVSTNDGGDGQGPLKLTLPQTDCLARAFPVIQSYFQGTSNVSEVGEAFNCASEAVTMFTANTQGANPDYYTPKEIRSFLEQFFLGDIKVSDSLLMETMRLKQVLLGGAIDKITRAELAQAQTVIQTVKNEAFRNHAYIAVYMQTYPRSEAQLDPAKVEVAIQNLQITAINLGAIFSKSSIVYETKDLKNLLNAIKPLFKNWSGPESIIKFIPTFELAKSVFLNPQGSKIAASDWQPLLTNAGKLYAIYLRSTYLMSGQNLMVGKGLAQMKLTVNEITSIIRSAIDVKPAKAISFTYIDEIVEEMIRLEVLDLGIRESTIKHLGRVALTKLFNPRAGKSRKRVDGLTLAGLNQINNQVQTWLDMQRVWDEVQTQAVYEDPRLKGQAIPLKTVKKLWATKSSDYKQGFEDLRRTFNRATPLIYAGNDTVVFERSSSYQAYSQTTFNSLNWKSQVMRVLMNTYPANPEKDLYAGMTKPEVKVFFDDVHELASDFMYVEPNDNVIWDTSFDEANMFTFSAENNSKISYNETLDWMSLVLGGGIMQKRLYADLKDRCAQAGKDYFGRKQVAVDCMRKRHAEMFPTVYKELPNWVRVQKSLDDEGVATFQDLLEVATRDKEKIGQPVGISELTRMTMVMQYIESMYTRYDENSSGTLEYAEAEKAYPLFREVLTASSGLKTDKSNFGLFCWLLKKGKAPTSVGEKADFAVIWLRNESKWKKISADRLKVLGIVASLKTAG